MTSLTAIKFGPRLAGLALLTLLLSAVAFSQAKQNFTLHNNTGKTIKDVYIGPSRANTWGPEVLGVGRRLPTGKEVDIVFSPTARADHWDLKIVFADDSSGIWKRFDLSQLTDIYISYKHGEPWATWKNGD